MLPASVGVDLRVVKNCVYVITRFFFCELCYYSVVNCVGDPFMTSFAKDYVGLGGIVCRELSLPLNEKYVQA